MERSCAMSMDKPPERCWRKPAGWSRSSRRSPAGTSVWRPCAKDCTKPTASAWCGYTARAAILNGWIFTTSCAAKGELTVRQYIAYFLNPPELTPADIEKVEQARRTYRDDWIAAGAVKTMLDGVVEAHTAAMLAPYSDDPTKSGKLFWDSAKYQQAIAELDRRGFQIFTHAIGDRAVRLALDAYEQAQTKNRTKDARPRVEHIETITAE